MTMSASTGMLPGELRAHAHARLVQQLAAHSRVRPGEVDVLQQAERAPLRLDGTPRGDAGGVQPHDLARLDLAQELGADLVQRARFRGDDVAAAVDPSDAERPDAVWVADAEDRVPREHRERVRAVRTAHHLREALFPRGAGGGGDQLRQHLGVSGRLERDALRLEVGAEDVGVDHVAVVGERQLAALTVDEREMRTAVLHEQRLDVAVHTGSSGRVPGMADRGNAVQPLERFLIENLGDEAHLGKDSKPLAVRGGDACRFLTAVLECVESEEGKPGYVFTRCENTEDAAFFLQAREDHPDATPGVSAR